jgi:hypothetical protein
MTIINQLEVLGLPLAVMLLRIVGATVYSVNVDLVLQFWPDDEVWCVGASSATAVKRCIGMMLVIVSGVPSTSFRVPTQCCHGEEQLRRRDCVGQQCNLSGRDLRAARGKGDRCCVGIQPDETALEI